MKNIRKYLETYAIGAIRKVFGLNQIILGTKLNHPPCAYDQAKFEMFPQNVINKVVCTWHYTEPSWKNDTRVMIYEQPAGKINHKRSTITPIKSRFSLFIVNLCQTLHRAIEQNVGLFLLKMQTNQPCIYDWTSYFQSTEHA